MASDPERADPQTPRRRRLNDEKMKAATKFLAEWRARIMTDRNVSPATFRAAYALSLHTDWLTFESFVSQETIAKEIHAAKRTIIGAFKQLEACGYLQKRRRGRTSNLYVLTAHEVKKTAHQENPDMPNFSHLTEDLTCRIFHPRSEKTTPMK